MGWFSPGRQPGLSIERPENIIACEGCHDFRLFGDREKFCGDELVLVSIADDFVLVV